MIQIPKGTVRIVSCSDVEVTPDSLFQIVVAPRVVFELHFDAITKINVRFYLLKEVDADCSYLLHHDVKLGDKPYNLDWVKSSCFDDIRLFVLDPTSILDWFDEFNGYHIWRIEVENIDNRVTVQGRMHVILEYEYDGYAC